MKKTSLKNGKTISKSKEQREKEALEAFDRALAAPPSKAKIRINTFIDLDIFNALVEEAERTNGKYQTLLNKYLRAAVLKEVSESDLKAIKIALGA